LTDEQTLVQQLRAGDDTAFRRLVALYEERVLNTCLGFVPDMQDAEDLAQEVFVDVFRSIEGFRGDAGLSTWIYRLATNRCLGYLRRQKRQRVFLRWSRGGEVEALQTPDLSNHPGIRLENAEQAAALYKALNQLPENQHAAFVMHKVEGLRHAEIAEVLEVSVSAVESLLHRAKIRLQQLLENDYRAKKDR